MTDLGETLSGLLPFVAAGAFLPTWTRDVIILLGTGRPLLNASAYVAGNAAFRLGLGVAVLYGLDVSALTETSGRGSWSSSPWVLGLGAAALLGLASWLATRPPRATDELPKWLQAFERLNPAVSFLLGAAFVAAPGIQYVYFLGGMDAIAGSGVSDGAKLLLLLAFVLSLQVMLVVPIVLYAVAGDRARRPLDSFKRWLGRYGARVGGLILGVFGAYLGWLTVLALLAR